MFFLLTLGLSCVNGQIPLRFHLPVVTAGVGATEVGFVAGAWVPEEQQLYYQKVVETISPFPMISELFETFLFLNLPLDLI